VSSAHPFPPLLLWERQLRQAVQVKAERFPSCCCDCLLPLNAGLSPPHLPWWEAWRVDPQPGKTPACFFHGGHPRRDNGSRSSGGVLRHDFTVSQEVSLPRYLLTRRRFSPFLRCHLVPWGVIHNLGLFQLSAFQQNFFIVPPVYPLPRSLRDRQSAVPVRTDK